MSARTNKNESANTDATSTVVPPEAYEAFANALRNGYIGSFNDWFASEDAKTAMLAFQDQQNAAMRAERMANSKAIWRDLKAFGTIASDKGIAAAKAERDYLVSLDLDNLEPTEEAPVSTRSKKSTAAPTTDDTDDTDDAQDDQGDQGDATE